VTELHNNVYQYYQKVCIYPGDGGDPIDSLGNSCN